MAIVRDGTTFRGQKVLHDGEALVRAITEPAMEHVSAQESGAFSWVSAFTTGGTDVTVLTIENINTSKDLVIERVLVGSDTNTVFKMGHVTSGTPAGTALTPVCLNRDGPKTSQDNAFGNAAVTGSVVLSMMGCRRVPANDSQELYTEGAVILGNGDAFGIECTANASIDVTILGYFSEIAEL